MQRRKFLQQTALASAAMAAANYSSAANKGLEFPLVRTAEANRKFKSVAVEKLIIQSLPNIVAT